MLHANALFGLVFPGLALVLAPGLAGGQGVSTLLRQGDTIVGVGELAGISFVATSDANDWTALVDTDFVDMFRDGALVRSGFPALREDLPLFDPPGFRLDEWISIDLASSGHMGMLLRVRQDLEPEDDIRDGAFWNLRPVAMVGTLIADPGNVPASTAWDQLDVVKLNARNELFVLGSIKLSPAAAPQDALVRYRLGATGSVLETTVLATVGTLLAPLSTVAASLSKAEHVLEVNDKGDFIVFVGIVGADAVLINMDTVVAEELQPSPVPGRTWRTLNATKVFLNDRGDHVVSGTLNGPPENNFLIARNGQKFAQSGDVLPTLSPAPLGPGLAAPVVIANTGDVFWSPRFDDADDESFARNHVPIVKRGQVLPDGSVVSALPAAVNAFGVSPDGRFFVGRVETQGIGSTVVSADFGLVLELPGCAGNPGTLRLESGLALVGGRFALALDQAQVTGALPALSFSTRPASESSECGNPTPFGELLLARSSIQRTLVLPPWDGSPTVVQFDVPNTIALIDARFFAQAAFIDPRQPSPEKYRLTNGLRIELGAP